MATKNQASKKPAAKAAPAKSKAEALKKGQVVKFIGWDGDAPDGAEDILEGMVGKVRSVSADEVEVAVDVDGENVIVPFSPTEVAIATKADIAAAKEITAADDDEDEDYESEEDDQDSDDDDENADDSDEEEEEQEDEDEDEDEDEEEAPTPAKKTPAKKASAKKAATVVEEEEEEPAAPQKPARQPSVGKLADDGDKAAIRELTKRAKAVGLDTEAYETWREIEKALKAEEKEASRPELIIVSEVKEEIGTDGKAAVAAAKRLVETAERTYYTLGGVLAFIDRNATYESVKVNGERPYQGKEGFEAFCEDNLGIAYRKAKYLIAIYEAFTGAGLNARKIQSIGWSKAKELVAILREEPSNADKWIETAKKVGTAQLQEQVKAHLTKIGAKQHGNSKTVKSVVCKFVVHEDEGEVVTEALALAKEQAETDSDSAAFAYIMKEWLTLQG